MEAAAGRRIDRARDLAGQDDLLARARRDATGSAAAKSACVYGCLGRVATVSAGQLDDLAEIHHRDAVAHVRDGGQVVGDEEVGQRRDRAAGRAAGSGSARGSRRRARTPARPARRARGRAPARARWRCAGAARPRTRAGRDRPTARAGPPAPAARATRSRASRLRRALVGDQRLGDDSPTRMRGFSEAKGSWKTAWTDAAVARAGRRRRGRASICPSKRIGARGGLLQPQDQLGRRGLAGAGLADDAQRAARFDRERHPSLPDRAVGAAEEPPCAAGSAG